MTIFFQKLFECAARGCPSFLARVTSVKSAVALKKRSTRCKFYTYTSTNGKWTFHACSSKTLTVKFKVQTKQFFQEIVLLQMLSWPWPVYCSWSLRLLSYDQILNSQTFRSASGRSLPHSNLGPPQSWQSLWPHHSLEIRTCSWDILFYSENHL